MVRHWIFDRAVEPIPEWIDALPGLTVLKREDSVTVPDEPNAIFWCRCRGDESLSSVLDAIPFPSKARLVVLADTPDELLVTEAFALGAVGCCNSYAASEVIRQVATVVENGGLWIGRSLLQNLVKSTGRSINNKIIENHSLGELSVLSDREMQVAKRVGAGASNKEIAVQLSITERTVKAHLSAIFEKLGLRDRLQLSLRVNGQGIKTLV